MPRAKKTLEQEAKEFKQKKTPKMSAADRTIVRSYMGNILGALLVNASHRTQPEEALKQAYDYAVLAKQFEKDNF